MRARATIIDVARAAGVSVGTASDALNGKGRVSVATRTRVVEAAAELAFTPHPTAQGLPRGLTMLVGLSFGYQRAVPAGAFFIALLDAAAEVAADNDYSLVIRRGWPAKRLIVDGLILVDPSDADVASLADETVPVVTVGQTPGTSSVPWVDVDHRDATRTLLDHLATRDDSVGLSRPAWLVSVLERPRFVQEIEAAFETWATENRREHVILHAPDDPYAADEVVSNALATLSTPGLVATTLDRQAVGARHALQAAGVLSALGSASDGDTLGLLLPPVAAMSLDGAAHGRAAMLALFEWLRTGDRPPSVQLPAELIDR